uniref:Uncharacterized protein n=1 Tax=Chromera velia CCMP2878 TaxID=1169474 RepID=A0A0G4HCS1_9ALVE|eukprot:Cvel_26307.t1-p1 / transcript=Cvel_26307.t1 / gene=Cvel_26307 / organism=Chromera_velia_CCMP2878 / gene_product=hypothetical protein / transcript_product=hypothetical protein / location=Cvel_scaffold3107:4024-5042(+) / protein_length=78 / sequence_SO=supercontig / SO=protein_coding / is_pseudo=false
MVLLHTSIRTTVWTLWGRRGELGRTGDSSRSRRLSDWEGQGGREGEMRGCVRTEELESADRIPVRSDIGPHNGTGTRG